MQSGSKREKSPESKVSLDAIRYLQRNKKCSENRIREVHTKTPHDAEEKEPITGWIYEQSKIWPRHNPG
jgi:hypothetical protein